MTFNERVGKKCKNFPGKEKHFRTFRYTCSNGKNHNTNVIVCQINISRLGRKSKISFTQSMPQNGSFNHLR